MSTLEANKKIKKVIPVTGNLRKKFLKELKGLCESGVGSSKFAKSKCVLNEFWFLGSQTGDNNVKEPLKPPHDNKIIIQKVENVKMEVITNSTSQRRLSSLFTSFNDQNSAANQTNGESSQVEGEEEQQVIFQDAPIIEIFTPSIPLKLVTAKIPDNSNNTSVPLKVIRTLKAPKLKPNLLHRIHKVQTITPPEVPEVEIARDPAEFNDNFEILIPRVTMEEQQKPKDVQESESEDFCGFDPIIAEAHYDTGMWSTLLSRRPKDDAIKLEEEATKAVEQVPKEKEEKVNTLEHTRRSTRVNSVKERLSQEKENSPKKSTGGRGKLLSPKPGPSTAVVGKVKAEKKVPAPTVTSTPVLPSPSQGPSTSKEASSSKALPSTSKSVPSTSTTLPPTTTTTKTPTKSHPESEEWMENIHIVLGPTRIQKIDESLKTIPNLITGNFNEIETENVELKLVIKHLLKQMGVETILETVKPEELSMSFDEGLLLILL
jgi:hypothetical protein